MSDLTLVGEVGVDSGQLMLTDPCYVNGEGFKDDAHDSAGVDLNAQEAPREDGYSYSYGGACAASANALGGGPLKYSLGHLGAGVCVSTGFGDGSYPVYVEYDKETGRVARVVVDFM